MTMHSEWPDDGRADTGGNFFLGLVVGVLVTVAAFAALVWLAWAGL